MTVSFGKMLLKSGLLLVPMGLLAEDATARLVRLSNAEGKSLASEIDLSKLPPGAQHGPYGKSQFVLKAPGQEDLGIVPFAYHVETSKASALPEQCSIFFVTPVRQDQVLLLDPDVRKQSLCSDIKALGTMLDAGPRPRLIIIYDSFAPDGNAFTVPFVLSWDSKANAYKPDVVANAKLYDNRDANTVAGVRRQLSPQK